MIKRLLIANRGEIAQRIQRTAKRLGIETVAVHHPVDAGAPWMALSDQTVELQGTPPVQAYLDMDQIIAAAKSSGADAIHPGFGFLSENARFAKAVIDAGLIWVGPDPDAIELMGDKQKARAFAERHGVPLAPSAEADDPSKLAEAAAKIGTPLLIKAAAGGGGKGMRIVREDAELKQAIESAISEAERAFGDGRVYAERYVDHPRHVEVQVLGDGGKAIHLGTRDCSIQRRFQKIVEEAPAPALPEGLLREIEATAVKLAEACNYRNAGTVEFIVAPDGAFYFLEMNTRLQVEHPVTEEITGVDLVAEQLAIAAGGELRFSQADIRFEGHSVEVRIYAEDADAGFLPAAGRLLLLEPPAGVRWESGIETGGEVTADFDPMIAKLVVSGPTREAAVRACAQAIGELTALGVTTNQFFLKRVLEHPAFMAADVHTGFIDEHGESLALPPLDEATRDRLALRALAECAGPAAAPERALPIQEAAGDWRN
ncbi:acetyl-CoA carboxylase biotin carboxylase subunit [Minwuia thermotolerans]|uniref:Biotin carboxylase n=1 Tax=Minwuia thermotolerans TaxID=2056226 RepID=A0A2M9FYI5_9PROT|nr:biotin carboxylase N-terminal domain-containing protein [Minwuia thermotolerans]PJK28525.1 biotin carboxylase [Minwuia thermotolerans]